MRRRFVTELCGGLLLARTAGCAAARVTDVLFWLTALILWLTRLLLRFAVRGLAAIFS